MVIRIEIDNTERDGELDALLTDNGVELIRLIKDARFLGVRLTSTFRKVPEWNHLGANLLTMAYELAQAVDKHNCARRAEKSTNVG